MNRRPPSTKVEPQNTERQPQSLKLRPRSTERQPQSSNRRPRSTERQPQSSERQAWNTARRPLSYTLQVQRSTHPVICQNLLAKRLCDQQGNLLRKPIRIVGWLYPGATRTHNAFGERTKFEVTPEKAFLLLFAPVACWYFMLPTDSGDRAAQYALVLPTVNDLAAYAEIDRAIRSASYEHYWAANLEEAGLKLLMLQEEKVPIEASKVRRCQSVLFGKTKWTGQQSVRKKVAMIEAAAESLLNYQLSDRCLPKNVVCKDKAKAYIGVSGTRGMIAANLARGLAWWFCLSGEDGQQSLSGRTCVEREGLLKMIEEAEWQDQSKKLFVKACHQALQRIYAKIYDRTPEGEYAQIERRHTRLRSELGRCKNVTTLRHAISRLFAEAGQIPIFQEHWEELLPLTTGEVDWRITRDLALLALSTAILNRR